MARDDLLAVFLLELSHLQQLTALDFTNVRLKELVLSSTELLHGFTLLQLRLVFTRLYLQVTPRGRYVRW